MSDEVETLVHKELKALREDVQLSVAARERLGLLIKWFTFVGVILWITTVGLFVLVEKQSDQDAVNKELNVELLQAICNKYHRDYTEFSPVCLNNDFVTPDGLSRK